MLSSFAWSDSSACIYQTYLFANLCLWINTKLAPEKTALADAEFKPDRMNVARKRKVLLSVLSRYTGLYFNIQNFNDICSFYLKVDLSPLTMIS